MAHAFKPTMKGKHASNAAEWFTNYDKHKPEDQPQKFRRRVYKIRNEKDEWNFLACPGGGGKPWEIERGGSKWTQHVVHKRRHGAIKPAAQREAFEHSKSIIKAQHAVKRRKEIGSQIKANGYKSIISWRKDPTVDVKRPMPEKRLVRKIPDRAASIARMELQDKAKLRSSLTRFYFPCSPKKSRQDTLKKAGLLAARKSCVIGDGGGNRRMRSFGVADAFTHSVYGGKALNSEWDLKPIPFKPVSAPNWYGHRSSEPSGKPSVKMQKPDWFG